MTGVKEPITSSPPRRTGKPAKVRAPRGQKRQATSAEAKIVSDVATRSKQQRHGNALVVGAVPRVDLLPTEVLVDRRQRAVVRRAWLGVVVVGVLMVLGIALASTSALSAKSDLAASQAETNALVKERQSYSSVQLLEQQTALLKAAQEVGGSTEIDWAAYLQSLEASLPSGVSITGVSVDSASPLETYAQATGPLEGQRVATLTIDASSSTLPSVPDWLDSVKTLSGYVDANANSVTLDSSTELYTVDMTIHVNKKAFDKKYAEKGN